MSKLPDEYDTFEVPQHAPVPIENEHEEHELQNQLAELEEEVAKLQLQKEKKAMEAELERVKLEKMKAQRELDEEKQRLRGVIDNEPEEFSHHESRLGEPSLDAPPPEIDESLLRGEWDGLHVETGSYARILAPLDFETVTVSAWAFLSKNDAAEMHTIVSNKELGCQKGARGYALYVNDWESNDGQLILEWGDDSMGCHKLKSGNKRIQAKRWNHFAFSLTRSMATLYVNGEKVGSSSSLREQLAVEDLLIGQFSSGDYSWDGALASIIVWDSALDVSQIRTVMEVTAGNKGQNKIYPSPRAFLPLSEAKDGEPGTKLVDVESLVEGRYEFPPKPIDFSALGGGDISEMDLQKSDELGRQRAAAIRDGFRHAWKGYKDHAWGADEVKPQSGRRNDNWGGMGVTLVDSLDTLWLMGLKDEFWEARDWVRDHLSFQRTGQVSVFETTIRELGGLLSAYDLSGDKVFLQKAEDLGGRLAKCFNSKSGIPFSSVHLQTGASSTPGWTGGNAILSELGTLQVEFRYLSKHTGNKEYGRKATKVFEILKDKPTTDGLAPIYVSINNGNFVGSKITFGALGDSYYEYLLKVWLQGGKKETYMREMYDKAVQGVHDKLVQHTTPSGLTYLADLEGGRLKHKMDHLACFMSATLALGAHTDPQGIDSPRAQRDFKVAKELGYTCYQMYHRQKTGLSAEYVNFQAGKDIVLPAQASFYILRPEAVEAIFYLYFFTKDPIYREWSWEIFQAIDKHCRTNIAYGAHPDVRNPSRKPDDRMESFFLAETFKYLYLIQDPDQPIDLYKYVFNTEAHPMKVFDQWP